MSISGSLLAATIDRCRCLLHPVAARERYESYLSDLRVEAISQYWEYNLREQAGIGQELNSPESGPINELLNIHKIANPPKLVPPPCPKSDCTGC